MDEKLKQKLIEAVKAGDENQAMDKVYSSSIEVISRMENSIKH